MSSLPSESVSSSAVDPNNSSPTAADALAHRQATVLAQLQSRDAERQAAVQQRALDRSKLGAAQFANLGLSEKLQEFLDEFDDQAKNLQNRIDEGFFTVAAIQGWNDEKREEYYKSLENPLESLQSFQSGHSHLLPLFDLSRSNEILRSLREKITQLRDSTKMKKKFGFGGKIKVKPAAEIIKEQKKVSEENHRLAEEAAVAAATEEKSNNPSKSSDSSSSSSSASTTSSLLHSNRYEHLSHQTIIPNPQEITGKDLFLSHLSHCTVYICGSPKIVYLADISHCTISIGPCSGSILLYRSQHSHYQLAGHQIRLHSIENSSFGCFVHQNHYPIIEEFNKENTRFSPYFFHYPQIEEDWKRSKLSNHRIPMKEFPMNGEIHGKSPIEVIKEEEEEKSIEESWQNSFCIIDFLQPEIHLQKDLMKSYLLPRGQWRKVYYPPPPIEAVAAIEGEKKKE